MQSASFRHSQAAESFLQPLMPQLSVVHATPSLQSLLVLHSKTPNTSSSRTDSS